MMNDDDDPNFPHEDYAILLGATAPGTAKSLLSRDTACTGTDIAVADLMYGPRPSGIVLPQILRRKLRLVNKANELLVSQKEQEKSLGKDGDGKDGADVKMKSPKKQSNDSTAESAAQDFLQQTFSVLNNMERVTLFERVAHNDAKRLHSKSPIAHIQGAFEQIDSCIRDDHIDDHLPDNYEIPEGYKTIDHNRVFTTSQLEKNLSRANAALMDIHKQLHRGEEIYFQDTDSHGNMYKGWDAFIDTKAEHLGIQDIENFGEEDIASIVQCYSTIAPTRKMHSDMRWFSSSSCTVENGTVRGYNGKKSQRTFSSTTSSAAVSPVPFNQPISVGLGSSSHVLADVDQEKLTINQKETEAKKPASVSKSEVDDTSNRNESTNTPPTTTPLNPLLNVSNSKSDEAASKENVAEESLEIGKEKEIKPPESKQKIAPVETKKVDILNVPIPRKSPVPPGPEKIKQKSTISAGLKVEKEIENSPATSKAETSTSNQAKNKEEVEHQDAKTISTQEPKEDGLKAAGGEESAKAVSTEGLPPISSQEEKEDKGKRKMDDRDDAESEDDKMQEDDGTRKSSRVRKKRKK